MIKLATVALAAVMLSGCYAAYPVKYAADKICDATKSEKSVLKEKFDAATEPHKIRVFCNGEMPYGHRITGDVE